MYSLSQFYLNDLVSDHFVHLGLKFGLFCLVFMLAVDAMMQVHMQQPFQLLEVCLTLL